MPVDVTVQYAVTSRRMHGDAWLEYIADGFTRPQAERYYDEILRLEKAYGTPRAPALLRRTITVTDWKVVNRHGN